MRKMDEKTERLHQAARAAKLLDPTTEQTSLARLLNVAPQNVHNWKKRGVSKDAAIEAQLLLGISATWVLYGKDSMMIPEEPKKERSPPFCGPAWPFGDYARYEALSDGKKCLSHHHQCIPVWRRARKRYRPNLRLVWSDDLFLDMV